MDADATLTEALAATRKEYLRRNYEALEASVRGLYAKLEAVHWDANVIAPYPKSFGCSRDDYRRAAAYHAFVRKWTRSAAGSRPMNAPDIRKPLPDLQVHLTQEVEMQAGASFDSYVAKLTGKIGQPVRSAILSGPIWSGSVLTVETADGKCQTWNTKIIINRSVHGKLFNQFPSRIINL